MKRRSFIILLSAIFLFVLIFSLTLPLFSQSKIWTRITTNNLRVRIKNISEDVLIVKWDIYVRPAGEEDTEKPVISEKEVENFEIENEDTQKEIEERAVVKSGINKTYIQTYILPGETFLMPECRTVFIKVPKSKVSVEGIEDGVVTKGGFGLSTVVVSD
jgi:hypothetical protein